jgi:hypothetical protein
VTSAGLPFLHPPRNLSAADFSATETLEKSFHHNHLTGVTLACTAPVFHATSIA